MPMPYEPKKFRALVHYIIDIVEPSMLGKTKLNKILWFSERKAYLQSGKTITGETYVKFPEGPVAKHLLEALKDLKEEGVIVQRLSRVYDFNRHEYFSLSRPDISMFTQDEIDIVAREAVRIASMTAKEISNISHDRTWETFEMNEPIPMVSVLASNVGNLTPDDVQWAES